MFVIVKSNCCIFPKNLYAFIFLLALFLINSGCSRQTEKSGIVAIGPNITEILFAIGAQSQIKGIGDFDDYPPQTQNLTRVGTYLSPNLEKITTLNPATIIVSGEVPQLRELSQHLNIQYHAVPMDTLQQIYDGILLIGELTHSTRRAQLLIDTVKQNLQRIENLAKDLEPIPTLLVVSREPRDLSSIQVVGGKSFLSEILKISGGKNVYEDAEQPYFEISAEQVLSIAPEVVIEFHCGENLTQRQLDALFLDWKALDSVPAVQKSRIYFILESYGMRPGPRIYKIAEEIATFLHPEVKLGL
ncbi:MAG TPA: ABC transporter substrate-binding protein [Candidatus Hydrogenedens sp.]|nr:ABC transporter substrate-binding protein [Candidatus Hydrogenedens sp.]